MGFMSELTKDLKDKYAKSNPLIVNEMKKLDLDVISSGSVLIDAVSGIGGLCAKGHISEVVGANTSGKTTLCLQTAANCQKDGGTVVYIDSESVFDVRYAKALGIDTEAESFLLLQPLCGEEVIGFLDIVEKKLSDKKANGKIDLIVIDSVATTRPQEELEGNRRIGQHATLWSKLSYQIKNLAHKHNIAFILVNQMRYAPDISGGFGPSGVLDSAQNSEASENTTGGEALKYIYSIRWQLKGFSQITEEKENPITGEVDKIRVGNKVWATTIKNKLAPPMVKAQFAVVYGKGTQDDIILAEIMKTRGYITSSGTYIKYECLDPSLQANPNGNAEGKYAGYIYGRAKFDEWYYRPEIQADVRERFKRIVLSQHGEVETGDAVDEDGTKIEFDVEDASE